MWQGYIVIAMTLFIIADPLHFVKNFQALDKILSTKVIIFCQRSDKKLSSL